MTITLGGMTHRSVEEALDYAGRVYECLASNPHISQESRDRTASGLLRDLARQVAHAQQVAA